jgi:hypothetical protein
MIEIPEVGRDREARNPKVVKCQLHAAGKFPVLTVADLVPFVVLGEFQSIVPEEPARIGFAIREHGVE